MTDFSSQVTVDLDGNLTSETKRAGRAVNQFTSKAGRDFKRLKTMTGNLSNGINRLGNRYTGIISGAGFALAAKRVTTHAERMTYLGIQAERSQQEVHKLNDKLYETANSPDIRINPDQLLTAIEKIVEKTGDLDFATDNIRNMALAIRGAKADGQGLGGLTAELKKLGDFDDPKAVMQALDDLTLQGKQGAFTLENMAAQGERLFAAYGATGRGGAGIVNEIGTLAQVARMGTGSAEMATTAFEAMLRTLNDGSKQKLLQGAGIELFDPEKLAEGTKVLRPVPQLIKEIIAFTKGDATMLGEVFDAEAMRGINAAISDFQRNKGFGNTLDKFSNLKSNGTVLLNDSIRAAGTANAALQSLSTTWDQFSQKKLDGPLQSLADLSSQMKSEDLQDYLNMGLYGAMGVGGVWAANKVGRVGYSGYKGIQSLRGKGKSPIAGGLSAGGVTPVYVTNLPTSMGGGAGGDTYVDGGDADKKNKNRNKPKTQRTPKGGKFRLFTKAASWVTDFARNSKVLNKTSGLISSGFKNAGNFVKGAAPIALAMGAVNMGSSLLDGDSRGAVGAGGSLAGGLVGAKLGAMGGLAVGTVVPGLGNAVGAGIGTIVGGGLGAILGEEAVTAIFDGLTGDDNKVELNTQPLDDGFRSVVRALDDNTRVQTEKKTIRVGPGFGMEYGIQGGAL